MKVCVVGTGYVGLVAGTCLAEMGNDVICVDNNLEKLSQLKNGIIPIYEPGLEELIKANVSEGRLFFTSNLKEAVDLTLQAKGSARICDVASGPARYIIETLESYKDKAVTAELRDIDIRWLLEAKETAESRGINIEYKTANALEDNDFNFEKQPDIMVASGFYDWFDDKEIIKKSMSLIYNALPKNGYFVFSIQAGHVALSLTNKIFKDFNNHQLKMVTWDMDIINSILKEIGFSVILTRSDDKGHYPVLLAKKV